MHAVDKADMSVRTTILLTPEGSELYGVSMSGASDRDEQGVCVEDISHFVGFDEFEQYIYRSAAEREGKHDAPSQPGDIDRKTYSLKKFCRLALNGNPQALLSLFVPPEKCLIRTSEGAELQELATSFVSREAAARFLGFMTQQRQRMLGERGQKRVNRPALEAAHGYDTDYAYHILRLGYQGIELLTTGRVSLPLPEPERSRILALRRGEVDMNDMLSEAGALEKQLKDLGEDSYLPAHPDRARVEEWMIGVYFTRWQKAA